MGDVTRAGARRAGWRSRTTWALAGLVCVAAALTGAALSELRATRAELAWVRGRLEERRAQVKRQRDELAVLASEAERVAGAVAASGDRMAALQKEVRLEPVATAGVTPDPTVAADDGTAPVQSETAARALERLAAVEREAGTLEQSVEILAALVAPSRGDAGMPSRWPLKTGEVSSPYGMRNDADGTDFHPGVDIRAPWGTPVMASGAGVVVFAGTIRGYGNVVVVDHGKDVRTLYGHLSQIRVREGARLRAGEVLGAVGSTGRATGSHLHYEVRLGGDPVDPSCHLGPAARSARLPIPPLTTDG